MQKHQWVGGLSLAVALGGGLSYLAVRARAAGVPARTPMTYAGVLTDKTGARVVGTKNIQLQLWDRDTGGTTPVCLVGPSPLLLDAGAFKIVLPDACVAAVRDKPDLWIEVLVDGSTFGRRKISAVPYAIEAERATRAGGALETRLTELEADKLPAPRDTAGAVQRICTGATPVGATAWLPDGGLHVVVDTTGCKFTKKPIYIPVLAGETNHWVTTGGSSPYTAPATEKTQFTIFVNYLPGPVTPAEANMRKWHVQWMAIGN